MKSKLLNSKGYQFRILLIKKFNFSSNSKIYHTNQFVDDSNTKNKFYEPKNEMNYQVYEPKIAEIYTPSRPIKFENGKHIVFEFSEPKSDENGFVKLPQVPYEIKEHSLKGFLYTFFLTVFGRIIGGLKFHTFFAYSYYPFIPAAVFTYHYSKALWYMLNSVTKIELLEDGERVKLTYKYQPSKTVKICNLLKKKEENFFNECYTEPFLYPIEINETSIYGKYSLFSHKKIWLYGDSHENIKNGEVLRAILNNQNINV